MKICSKRHYAEVSVVVLGFWLGAGLDGQEFSGLPRVCRVSFRFPLRTVSSSLGLNVRGTKPSASATSTIHNGPGKRKQDYCLSMDFYNSESNCVLPKHCKTTVTKHYRQDY